MVKYDFFLSHASGDRGEAERLYDLLDGQAVVFLDSKSIVAGDDWDRTLAEAQRNSRATVVLVSANTADAVYQRGEITAAIGLQRSSEAEHRVIPVFLEPEPDNVPRGLLGLQRLMVSDQFSIERVAGCLLDLCRGLSAGAERAATPGRAGGRVLISYISADVAWATWLRALIRAAGCAAELQDLRFISGEDPAARQQPAAAVRGRILVVISEAFSASQESMRWLATLMSSRAAARKAALVQVEPCDVPLEGHRPIAALESLGADAAKWEVLRVVHRLGVVVFTDKAMAAHLPRFPGRRQQPDSPTEQLGGGVWDKLEGHLTGVGDVRLYWQGWIPKGQVIGVILLCHGAGEHSGRYQNVVNTLTPDGWAVYGMDLRGHGQSGNVHGKRVHVERFSDWVDDFHLFRREVTVRHLGLPVFVLGHSLGGQIALDYAFKHRQGLRGLVLSAPYLAAESVVPGPLQPFARFVLPVAALFVPRQRVRLVDLDNISKDLAVVSDYRNDPLVYDGDATLEMANIVVRQFDVLVDRSRSLDIPVLIQHGTEDHIAGMSGSERLHEAYGTYVSPDKKPDKKFVRYDGLWHEIYNDPGREGPLNNLREWLAEHR